jgi:tRNA-2-methylthio-N6-dimethylallyladenosine synthase
VLVEGPSRTSVRRDGWDGLDQLTGRTACDRIAVFDGPERLVGRMVRVAVEDASAVTLFGRVETSERVATPA